MRIAIDISDNAGPTLARIAEGVANRRPLNAAIGKRGEVETREHFRVRAQEPNKRGFPSLGFWNRIRKATALTAFDSVGATISISDPAILQKIHGGDITPKEGRYLTLPAIAAAYGRSPRTFSNLEPMFRWINGERKIVALVERAASDLKTQATYGGEVFYWLVEKVKQRKDPRALPPRDQFERALVDEAAAFVADLVR